MNRIYEIIDCNGLRYVGKTEQTLQRRFNTHKCEKKSGKNCSSSKLDLDNCDINLLEVCDDSVKKEREQYWMDKLDCVNDRRANGRDLKRKKEYNDNMRQYVYSWGGNQYNYNYNNLLRIDVNLFQ